jgi:1,4-dihydroxy-2-naphthoyl-CoA hydrolase
MPAPFEHRLRVRFQHTDPAGIVFFANVLVFCHEAYEELLRAGGAPLDALIAAREQVLPLGHAEATFRRPIRHGQLVTIRIRVARIGERSFELAYDVCDEAGQELATAKTAHVSVDPQSGQAVALAPRLRALLEAHRSG